eukprot:TRINITY_DN4400_c0_g1_i4.p1 TRINITY_DN4400_c0_g1~~TRINITY_DN4400_c0_g1_i4.p1  ORF type:complete len:392 (-),score=58.34 TRINITY_DN4400_c0_g1_i4:191-1366(-)
MMSASQCYASGCFRTTKPCAKILRKQQRKRTQKQMQVTIVQCVTTSQFLSTDTEIREYIQNGPLLEGCRISASEIDANLSNWLRIGDKFCKQLGFDKGYLTEQKGIRVYHYYLPICMWLLKQLEQHKKENGENPTPTMMVGMSAPQGCGKSTLVEQLYELFQSEGLRTVTFSLDDFYLTHKGQIDVSHMYENNPLLKFRGNAGTHDLTLAKETLSAAKQSKSTEGFSMAIPRYNKAAHKGLGDQQPKIEWPRINEPADIVLVEGWMLGFKAQSKEQVASIDQNLVPINEFLQKHVEFMDQYMDSWLVIKVQDPQHVFDWRLQAEHQMKAGGKPGMTDAQIEDFVSRFMPAYKAYLPDLYKNGPTTAKPGKLVVVEVDQARSPVSNQPKPIM